MGLMRMIILSLILCLMFVGLVFAQEETQTPYEIALQRIEEARVSGATSLDLSELGLGELPPEIGHLTSLQVLWIPNNQLQTLPAEIGNLTKLEYLRLDNNRLHALPIEIGRLSKLKVLWLPFNQLSDLPHEIRNLRNLCALSISYNQFEQLPNELAQLQLNWDSDYGCWRSLHGFYFDNNPLISPPPEVIEQGTAAILDYLRNEAWWHLQRLIAGGASSVGIVAAMVLGLRWRNWRRKGKKREKQFR